LTGWTLNQFLVPTIHQFLKDNKARVKKYTQQILHVGTNDIGNGLQSQIPGKFCRHHYSSPHETELVRTELLNEMPKTGTTPSE
jgi:hypothetical protein